MKMKPTAIPLLLLPAILTSMVVLRSTALADSKHVTFSEPVTIGSIILKPDTYRMVWIASGPEVQVSFMKGNKTVATASARLVLEKSPYRRSVSIVTDDSTALKQISFSGRSLLFDLQVEQANHAKLRAD